MKEVSIEGWNSWESRANIVCGKEGRGVRMGKEMTRGRGSGVPTGVRGTDFKKLFFVILYTPVSPVGLLINNSSELSAAYVTVLLDINVFETDMLKVLVLPPV